MPRQHRGLLDRRVQAEAECGVPTHHWSACQKTPTSPGQRRSVGPSDHSRVSWDPKPGGRRRFRSDVSNPGRVRVARFLMPRDPCAGLPWPPDRWREHLDGIWYVLTATRGEVRTRSGRRRRPTAAVVDSSSVKGITSSRATRGSTARRMSTASTSRPGRLRRPRRRRRRDRSEHAGPSRLPGTVTQGQTRRTHHRARLSRHGYRPNCHHGRGQGWGHRRHRDRTEARPRLHRPATPLDRRTHQRMDQPLPTHQLPLRSHPRSARRVPTSAKSPYSYDENSTTASCSTRF